MIILYFVLGGLYTILMITVGFFVGYYYKNSELPYSKIVSKITKRFESKKDEAGPVKSITKVEREAEAQKGFTDRVKELTTD